VTGHPPIEHGVKRRDLVNTHRSHVKHLRDVVHDADARPSIVLPLAKVEKGDSGGFFVLWWVTRDYLLCKLEVFWVELEFDLGRTDNTTVRILK
jgi:hypothetical protein